MKKTKLTDYYEAKLNFCMDKNVVLQYKRINLFS